MAFVSLATVAGCNGNPEGPEGILESLESAFRKADAGAVLMLVDQGYLDMLGGRGRLEDDLRQMFAVYGRMKLRHERPLNEENLLESVIYLRGDGFSYTGPLRLELARQGNSWYVVSGLLEIPRGIIDTLRERRLGLEEGDIGRFMRILSEDYKGPSGGRGQLIERLERDIKEGPRRALIVERLEIEADHEKARVQQKYLLILGLGKDKTEIRDTELLELRYQASRWRITGGLG
ncbi:MAG: hypothetical protein D6806_11615 [Deltaproteobacteria bacterium]|nr:MAG: hypothetical protein D6806_11615 [Deltaproteobacteria bacterium]